LSVSFGCQNTIVNVVQLKLYSRHVLTHFTHNLRRIIIILIIIIRDLYSAIMLLGGYRGVYEACALAVVWLTDELRV